MIKGIASTPDDSLRMPTNGYPGNQCQSSCWKPETCRCFTTRGCRLQSKVTLLKKEKAREQRRERYKTTDREKVWYWESEFRAGLVTDVSKRSDWVMVFSCCSGLAPLRSSSGLFTFIHTAVQPLHYSLFLWGRLCQCIARNLTFSHYIQNRRKHIDKEIGICSVAQFAVGIWPKNPIFSCVLFKSCPQWNFFAHGPALSCLPHEIMGRKQRCDVMWLVQRWQSVQHVWQK